jgi:hypothetical protein
MSDGLRSQLKLLHSDFAGKIGPAGHRLPRRETACVFDVGGTTIAFPS